MKILFLGNQFYDYQHSILEILKTKGHEVSFVSVDYNRSMISRICNKILGKYLYNNKHLNDLYKQIVANEYDRLFILVGNTISQSFLKKVCKLDGMKSILYLWDDINRVPNYNQNKKYYNHIITFDKHDALSYSLQFVPLFHRGCNYISDEKDIDLLFVGWLHSDRIEILKKIYNANKDLQICFRVFMNENQYQKNKDLIPDEWILKEPIPSHKLYKLMGRTKGIIDINHPTQRGLTMRTIESLPYNLKIFTTNPEIKDYDFYNPKLVSLIDRKNPKIDRKVLFSQCEYDKRIIDNYSIENWVNKVIINNLEE